MSGNYYNYDYTIKGSVIKNKDLLIKEWEEMEKKKAKVPVPLPKDDQTRIIFWNVPELGEKVNIPKGLGAIIRAHPRVIVFQGKFLAISSSKQIGLDRSEYDASIRGSLKGNGYALKVGTTNIYIMKDMESSDVHYYTIVPDGYSFGIDLYQESGFLEVKCEVFTKLHTDINDKLRDNLVLTIGDFDSRGKNKSQRRLQDPQSKVHFL
jgi:hypothetical protein